MAKAKNKQPVETAADPEEPTTPKVLPPHPELPRGPIGMRKFSFADADPDPEEPDFDASILNHVMGRLWRQTPFTEPILALEILDGPYKGVVYSYSSFTFLPGVMADGMVPTKYETAIHIIPDHLADTFTKDEAFDHFTSEVLIAWIGYIHTTDFSPLIKVKTHGIQ